MNFIRSLVGLPLVREPEPEPVKEIVRQFKTNLATCLFFKIENFSLLIKNDVCVVHSSVFDLGGHKWILSVRPTIHVDRERYVSIALVNLSPINIALEYELFVVSQPKATWHYTGKFVFEKSPKLCVNAPCQMIPLADLENKGYLIGNCYIFGVKFFGIEPAYSKTVEYLTLIEKPLNHKNTWKISKFSSLDPETAHFSKEFVVGNRKWKIKVRPRQRCPSGDIYLSVYLRTVGFVNNAPKENSIVKYKMRILDQVNRDHIEKTAEHVFCGDEDVYGFDWFMPLKKLEEPYLVKDKLYVGVEFELISVSNIDKTFLVEIPVERTSKCNRMTSNSTPT